MQVNFKKVFSITLVTALLCACNEGTYHADNDHYHDDVTLAQSGIIDTYGTNSEFESTPLVLSPFVNFGEFEVFWDARSHYDYFVELRFNDQPSTSGSRLISSELCGRGFYCDDHQYQFCEYTPGFDIFCQSSSGTTQNAYIGDMVDDSSDERFLIVQVCDTAFIQCEYESHSVFLE